MTDHPRQTSARADDERSSADRATGRLVEHAYRRAAQDGSFDTAAGLADVLARTASITEGRTASGDESVGDGELDPDGCASRRVGIPLGSVQAQIPEGKTDPFWGQLAAPDREAMRRAGTVRVLAPGTAVCHQGYPASHVYVVLAGNVRVTAASAAGRQMLLAVRGPGDIMGELAAVDGRPQSATLIALDAVSLLVVAATRFSAMCEQYPRISSALMNVMAARLRDSDRQRVEFGGGSITHRVAALLVDLASRHGIADQHGLMITPVTQQELARSVAASRESVARVLNQLRQDGVITTGRRRITIHRIERLRDWASSGGSRYSGNTGRLPVARRTGVDQHPADHLVV